MKVIITPQGGGNDHPYIKQLVHGLQRLPGVEVLLAGSGSWPLWQTVRQFGRPDVIHLQWQHPFFLGTRLDKLLLNTIRFFVQWFVLRLLGVRFVWTVHELVRFGAPRARWELAANRLLAKVVDKIIVHCATAVPIVATACHVPPQRLQVIPHGHFVDHSPPAVPKKEARTELGLPLAGKLFLFFGHVKGYKGLEQLLNAFVRLDEPQVSLLIAGKPHGSATADIEMLARIAAEDGRVHSHLGFIPEAQIPHYFSACDLVVLPYTESLTSGVGILAASYGRATLMPRLGCMAEFPADAAIFYNPELPDDLYSVLQRSLAAPLEEMGTAARSYINQFSWPSIAYETYRVYQSVLPPLKQARQFSQESVGK